TNTHNTVCRTQTMSKSRGGIDGCACWPIWTISKPVCSRSWLRPGGRIRLDVLSPIACIALVPVLPALHASSPNIQLYLGVTDRVVDLIDENVDCVVCRGGSPICH